MGFTRNYYNWKYWFRERGVDLPMVTFRTSSSSGSNYIYTKTPEECGFIVEREYTSPYDNIFYNVATMYNDNRYLPTNVYPNYRMNVNMFGVIGDSNKNEDASDYQLGNKLNGISISLTIQTVAQDIDYTIKHIYILTGSNTTSEEITIKECGIGKQFVSGEKNDWSNNTYNSTTVYVLFFRKVLETPITVPVGKSFQIILDVTEDLGSPN